jgi:hypothetical protein
VTGALGGGLGGNMQFTIGTSANIVLGRSFDINFGANKIQDVPHSPLLLIFCGVVGGLASTWPIVYALVNDDKACGLLSIGFQSALDVALLALTAMITDAKNLQNGLDKKGQDLFGFDPTTSKTTDSLADAYQGAMVATAVIGFGIVPEVLAAKFENWDPPTSENVGQIQEA